MNPGRASTAIKRHGENPTGAGGQRLPLAPAVWAGDFVYVFARMPTDPSGAIVEGGIKARARRAIDNLKAASALAGWGVADVVKVDVRLDDPRDVPPFNRVDAESFGDHPPARGTVRAQLVLACRIGSIAWPAGRRRDGSSDAAPPAGLDPAIHGSEGRSFRLAAAGSRPSFSAKPL